MRVLLLHAYRRLMGAVAGKGLGRFRVLETARSFVADRLERGLIDAQGHKMFVDPIDTLELKANGTWEPLETAVVTSLVKEGDVVCDIGAHIGYYTLIMARLVGGRGKVFAFEPDPDNFAILKRNVRINGYRNVVVEQKAVGEMTGKIRLYRSETNLGDHRIYPSQERSDSVEVDCVRLDDYFEDYEGKIDFIKMDIQGAEWAAVQGGRSVWQRYPDLAMIVEFWPIGLTRFGVDPRELITKLESYGFRLFHLDEESHRILPVNHFRLLARYSARIEEHYTNLLCVTPSSGRAAAAASQALGDRSLIQGLAQFGGQRPF